VSDDGTLKNVMIAPGPPPYRDASTVDFETFADDLKAVLGAGIHLPFDPSGDTSGAKVYAYGVYGSAYTVAAYLHHHVVFSERVMGDTIQYRVGSGENESLPILEYAKLVAGTSTVPARKFSRQ
jgi:hypothetical protein